MAIKKSFSDHFVRVDKDTPMYPVRVAGVTVAYAATYEMAHAVQNALYGVSPQESCTRCHERCEPCCDEHETFSTLLDEGGIHGSMIPTRREVTG